MAEERPTGITLARNAKGCGSLAAMPLAARISQSGRHGNLGLATSAILAKCGPTPAFVFARVFAADGSDRRVANGIGLFANSEISRVWALGDVAPGG